MMLHIYYGADSFSRTQAVDQLKQRLDADGMLSVNTLSLDGTRVSLAELATVCDTVPFLSSHRLVVVTDLLRRAQPRMSTGRAGVRGRTASGEPDELEGLVDYVPRLPPTTTLLLLEGSLRSDNPLLGALRALGDVREFELPDEHATAAWIDQRSRSLAASFEPQAVRLLAMLTRGDLWTAAAEVEKLTLFASGRAVTEADVRLLAAAAQESNVFAMADAIAEERLDDALRSLQILLQGGAAGPYLLTMIARQFRQMLIVQDLVANAAPYAEITRAAELRSDSALRRVMRQAHRWSPARLLHAYDRILDADLAIKRGEASEAVALELLVGDLAGPRGTGVTRG